MDGMLGPDYEAGLQKLKVVVESRGHCWRQKADSRTSCERRCHSIP